MTSKLKKNNESNELDDSTLFYLESSKKLLSFFNDTIEYKNPSIDLVMSSPTGCMVIVEVMKSYYQNSELTKQNLISKVVSGIRLNMNQSSVYKLVDNAISSGIFESQIKENDKRVRIIVPTKKTIDEMEKWFDKIKLV